MTFRPGRKAAEGGLATPKPIPKRAKAGHHAEAQSSKRAEAELATPKPIPKRAKAGFTLYEVIVVMILVMVLAGVVGPAFSNFLPGQRLTRTANDLLSALGKARADAVLTARRHRVVLDRESDPPTYCLLFEADPLRSPGTFRPLPGNWGAPVELPDGIRLQSVEGATEDESTGADQVDFAPDGAAASVTIVLGHEDDRPGEVRIRVNGADGRASIEESGE